MEAQGQGIMEAGAREDAPQRDTPSASAAMAEAVKKEVRYYLYRFVFRGADEVEGIRIKIGQSRDPEARIRRSLRDDVAAFRDFKNSFEHDQGKPMQERRFQAGIIMNPNLPPEKQGYKSPLVSSIAEMMHARHYRKMDHVHLYNKSTYAGHSDLGRLEDTFSRRNAFEAVMGILQPELGRRLQPHEILALNQHMGEIREHVEWTEGTDIVNRKVLGKIDKHLKEQLVQLGNLGFGQSLPADVIPPLAAGLEIEPIREVVLDGIIRGPDPNPVDDGPLPRAA